MRAYTDYHETRQSFKLCHGYACTQRTPTGIEDTAWRDILSSFAKAAPTPEEERLRIAKAVGQIENHINQKTGMRLDRAEAVAFETDTHQMGCIDEAVNTSRYLRFLGEEGVFAFHKAYDPVHRGYFIDGMWPHNSGAVQENETSDIYVIDSYYQDSGHPADIVALDTWLDNWKPEESLTKKE